MSDESKAQVRWSARERVGPVVREPCPTCEDGSVSPAYCTDDEFEPCPTCNGALTVEASLLEALAREVMP